MVREGKTMFQYSNEKDLGLTPKECENVLRTQHFMEILRVRRNVYYKELANDPSLSRSAVKGKLVFVLDRMIEAGQWDKAANCAMQLAKLEGWTSDGTNVNVFQDLTQKDIEKLRTKFTPGPNPSTSKDN